jgi:Holliday junction resolvase RusA-like endonuclease
MRDVIKYTIGICGVSKKNHLQMVGIGKICPTCKKRERMLPIQSKQYLQFEKDCAWFLKPKPTKPIDFPVNICCTFYMKTKRRVDGLNLLAAIDDILVKHGILEDDSREFVAGHDGSRVYYDKTSPRVEIVITTVDDYEQWKAGGE